MCNLPVEIPPSEKVVRIVLCDFHVNKRTGALKYQLFRPKSGTDEVSVVRYDYKGPTFCKAQGKKIAPSFYRQTYFGLADIFADKIRLSGSEIIDSRNEYCGHAHILHKITVSPNEPPEARENQRLTERCRELLSYTSFRPDPEPEAAEWTGEAF